MVTELKVNKNCFTTKTTVINIYSGLNPHIDIIVNILDVSREQEAKSILEDAFSNWFENDDVNDIPVGNYLKMCLDKAGINYEMYFKDTDEDNEECDFIQTSPFEKHYGIEDADGEPLEIIVTTPKESKYLLTDCDGTENNKPLVFDRSDDACKQMRSTAAEYIRLGFEKELQDVIYDEGHNLITVDEEQLTDIILDYADDNIDGVNVSEHKISIYYGDDSRKIRDNSYNTLQIFEIPL